MTSSIINRCTVLLIGCCWLGFCRPASAEIYISGHADIGVGFEDNNLHLHLHAEDALNLYGGGTAPAGEYEPGSLMIGVPDPAITRPAGSAWEFLAANAGDNVWYLPQSSNPNKPFLGIGTEDLRTSDGWSTVNWTFNAITTIAGDASEFAVWQNDAFGNPTVFASSLAPTGNGNSWTQAAFSHDHFNMGFTGQGIYDVSFTVAATNSGSGGIAAGDYADTASFRFVTGASVPEPGNLLAVGLALVGGTFSRRRS